jgi:hypothetical protein
MLWEKGKRRCANLPTCGGDVRQDRGGRLARSSPPCLEPYFQKDFYPDRTKSVLHITVPQSGFQPPSALNCLPRNRNHDHPLVPYHHKPRNLRRQAVHCQYAHARFGCAGPARGGRDPRGDFGRLSIHCRRGYHCGGRRLRDINSTPRQLLLNNPRPLVDQREQNPRRSSPFAAVPRANPWREAPPSVLSDISPTSGEIAVSRLSPSLTKLKEEGKRRSTNLPTCGGDVRQDRGGRLALNCEQPYSPPAGTYFPTIRKFETFIQAFSIPYAISAFFFAQTYPHHSNLPDNARASLDGNADHDRMSVGAAGAGRGAGASWHAGQKPVCGDE